jgi:hypothetical protein
MKIMFEAQPNSGCDQIAAGLIRPQAQRRDRGRDGAQNTVIVADITAKRMRKSENSHFSRILAFWPFFRWNRLPCNPFQSKQTGGFLGFPEKFSGGGIWGEGSNGC